MRDLKSNCSIRTLDNPYKTPRDRLVHIPYENPKPFPCTLAEIVCSEHKKTKKVCCLECACRLCAASAAFCASAVADREDRELVGMILLMLKASASMTFLRSSASSRMSSALSLNFSFLSMSRHLLYTVLEVLHVRELLAPTYEELHRSIPLLFTAVDMYPTLPVDTVNLRPHMVFGVPHPSDPATERSAKHREAVSPFANPSFTSLEKYESVVVPWEAFKRHAVLVGALTEHSGFPDSPTLASDCHPLMPPRPGTIRTPPAPHRIFFAARHEHASEAK
ncbi:hypothetical protein KC325_g179 [Hortaea werneckii]|nr:hypothetical protein KC325_g179 [Hortaea werneckii]